MCHGHKTRRYGFSQEFSFQKSNAILQLSILILVSRPSKGTNKFFKTVDNLVAPKEALVVGAIDVLFFCKDILHDCSLQRDSSGALLNSLKILSASFKGFACSASSSVNSAVAFY